VPQVPYVGDKVQVMLAGWTVGSETRRSSKRLVSRQAIDLLAPGTCNRTQKRVRIKQRGDGARHVRDGTLDETCGTDFADEESGGKVNLGDSLSDLPRRAGAEMKRFSLRSGLEAAIAVITFSCISSVASVLA
jgi:hypothetical protein